MRTWMWMVAAVVFTGLGAGGSQLAGQEIRQPQRAGFGAGGQAPRQTAPAQPAPQQPRAQQPRTQPAAPPFVQALKPAWAPQPADQQQQVKQVLVYWQDRSAQVKTYQCDFHRWKYDPVFVPADPKTGELRPQEYSKGVIKYAMPDKALYKDTETHIYDASQANGWKKLPEDSGHHWICDGTSILEFVAANKQVVKTVLPDQLRGEALRTQGPLPFLFGAKADEILQRYWVRLVAPPTAQAAQEEFHLEAWPKLQADAANFKLIKIILDRKRFLPTNMVVYNVNFSAKNPARTSYKFDNRKENPFDITKLNPWKKDFFEPPVPKGWTMVNQPVGGQPAASTAQPPQDPRQAQRPQAGPPR